MYLWKTGNLGQPIGEKKLHKKLQMDNIWVNFVNYLFKKVKNEKNS